MIQLCILQFKILPIPIGGFLTNVYICVKSTSYNETYMGEMQERERERERMMLSIFIV